MNYLEAEPSRYLVEKNFIFSLMKTIRFQTFFYTTEVERRGILTIKVYTCPLNKVKVMGTDYLQLYFKNVVKQLFKTESNKKRLFLL